MSQPATDDRLPALVWVIAAAFVTIELAFSAGYGFQQDELYFIEAGRHLAFGYVDQPPIDPLLARLATTIGGTNPTAVRTLPALAGGAIIVLAARQAAIFGAGRIGRILAALCLAGAPVLLGAVHIGNTTPPALLSWTLVVLCVTTAIAGKPGDLCSWAPTSGAERWVTLSWERGPGQWVEITGNGRYATEESVRALAAIIVDEPQPMPLQLHLAPAGWTLDAFKGDSIITLRNPADPRLGLSVQAIPQVDPDVLHNTQGARHASTVQINGQPAQLIRTEDEWFLQAPLPDGTAFNLQAPLLLTQAQIITIGEQVSRS